MAASGVLRPDKHGLSRSTRKNERGGKKEQEKKVEKKKVEKRTIGGLRGELEVRLIGHNYHWIINIDT